MAKDPPNPFTEKQYAQPLDAYRPAVVTEGPGPLAIPTMQLGGIEPFPADYVAESFKPRLPPELRQMVEEISKPDAPNGEAAAAMRSIVSLLELANDHLAQMRMLLATELDRARQEREAVADERARVALEEKRKADTEPPAAS